MRGIMALIFKNPMGDCSNNGFSSKDYKCYLFAEGLDGNYSEAECADVDYLVIIKGPMNTLRAVPKSLIDSGAWVTFGGNFVYASDSRFSKLNNGSPIKIFDRVE